MKIYKIFLILILFCAIIMTSCDRFLDPMPEQRLSEENIIGNPAYAEGLLVRAYKLLPTNYDFVVDIASDDAVTNKTGSVPVNNMVLGWTSNDNPLSQWGDAYEAFLYVHKFMEVAPEVTWDWRSSQKNALFGTRLMGEAYALRALWGFELLRAHAGVSGSVLYGYPIVTRVLSDKDNIKLPRNTYAECVNQILSDLDSAIVKLPLTWADKKDTTDFNETQGAIYTNRINGLTAKLIKSRVLLHAASPAFSASGFTWQQAASAAASVMVDKGGLVDITFAKVADVEFYNNFASKEIIWASTRIVNKNEANPANWAKLNFPPSKFGNGETNPSQNLVNVFPMLDGTPFVNDSNISVNQYKNRDPRLAKYLVYNGMTFGGSLINILDVSLDAPGKEKASLTGYYLRKFISDKAKLKPSTPEVGMDQFYTYARYTEALLNFAEAANEVGGPDDVTFGYSARAVINAIRTRAGITSSAYINSLDKDGLRNAIKNERRIELCFEGHRFWDIRRWNDITTMKTSVSGIRFSADNTSATVSEVQKRDYQDYMIYGPIPYSETLKYDIKQNNGWQ